MKYSIYNQDMLPTNVKYFKEELLFEVFQIPPHKPQIERILNVVAFPEVIHLKLIDTPVGYSNEGQRLSGVKLLADIKIKEKVTYVANEPTQKVHAAHFEFMKSLFVVLPDSISKITSCDLLSSNRLGVTPYIEAIDYRLLDCEHVYACIMLFLNVNPC